MNEINDGGINQFLRQRLNIVDQAVPAGSLAPEVFPVIDAKPATLADEWLRQVLLCAGNGYSGPPGAATYNYIRLANLATSGMIVEVEDCILNYDTGSAVEIGVDQSTTLEANQATMGVRDTRLTPTITRQTFSVLSYGGNAAAPWGATAKRLYYLRLSSNITIPLGIILRPGTSVLIVPTVVNTAVYFSLRWRERKAQPSELG